MKKAVAWLIIVIGLTAPLEAADIEYTKPQELMPILMVGKDDDVTHLGPLYSVGTIKEGAFKNYRLVVGAVSMLAPCKGSGCGPDPCIEPQRYARFLFSGKQLHYLRRYSPTLVDLKRFIPVLSKKNIVFTINEEDAFPEFTIPQTLTLPGTDVKLLYAHSWLDKNNHRKNLKQLMEIAPYGVAYMRTESIHPSESFISVFRPDSMVWDFKYPYPNELHAISISKSSATATYVLNAQRKDNPVSNVYPPATFALKRLQKLENTYAGLPLYRFADAGDPFIAQYYNVMSTKHQEVASTSWISAEDRSILPSKSAFFSSQPLIVMKDALGQQVVYARSDQLPLCLAEPIVYFYPPKPMHVWVRAKPSWEGSPSYAIPKTQGDSWELKAMPNGDLFVGNSTKASRHLFWEGWTHPMRLPTSGEVVSKAALKSHFSIVLGKLGLQTKEIADFNEAWLPKLKTHPYYLISWWERDTIEALAPLEVDPKPETSIRIVMDMVPLSVFKDIPSKPYPQTPERKGFSLVEWGGILRHAESKL